MRISIENCLSMATSFLMMNSHRFSIFLQAHFDCFAAEYWTQQQYKQQQWNFYSQRVQVEFARLPVWTVLFENIIPEFDALSIWIDFRDDTVVRDIQVVVGIVLFCVWQPEHNWIGIRHWIPAIAQIKPIIFDEFGDDFIYRNATNNRIKLTQISRNLNRIRLPCRSLYAPMNLPLNFHTKFREANFVHSI